MIYIETVVDQFRGIQSTKLNVKFTAYDNIKPALQFVQFVIQLL